MNPKKALTYALASLTLGALFTVAGCGGSKAEDAVAATEKIADEVCACKDMDCAKAAMAKMDGLKEKYGDIDETKVSEDVKKKMMAVVGKMTGCMMKLSKAAVPAPEAAPADPAAAPADPAAAPADPAAAPADPAAAPDDKAAPAGE